MVIVCRDTIVDTRWCVFGSFEGFRFPPKIPRRRWEEKTKMSLEDFLRAESKTFRLEAGQQKSIKVEQTQCMDQYGGWLVGWLVGVLWGFFKK